MNFSRLNKINFIYLDILLEINVKMTNNPPKFKDYKNF